MARKHGDLGAKLHIAVDTDTGQVAAAALTTSDVDDASQVGHLLDQVDRPVVSFTADGAYDQDGVCGEVMSQHPEASVIVPPRSSAVPTDTAQTAPTLRDRHCILSPSAAGWLGRRALATTDRL